MIPTRIIRRLEAHDHVVTGFGVGRLIRYRPHLQHGDVRWRIRLLQMPQELSLICKTRNQLTVNRFTRRLERLGYRVYLEPVPTP